jgi:23S rRNA pseudouridine955/2504/2580 synthase
MTFTTGTDDGDRRLDRILRKALPNMPLSGIHRLLRKGRVLVNGRPAAAEDRIAAGSIITVPDSVAPPVSRQAPRLSGQHPYPPLNILREEADLLVINKPAGLAVHGPASLNDQALAYLAGKLSPSLSFRPGPLHRLDKPTSGIIVFSKTLEGARRFSGWIREGRIKKQYLAIVEGAVQGPDFWEDLLVRDGPERKTRLAGEGKGENKQAGTGAAKTARTRIRPLARGAGTMKAGKGEKTYSLILADIETGRTHQIRAQAAARGFPLAGDTNYGGAYQPGGFFLLAWKLELPEGGPGSGGTSERRPLTITAPLPERFRLKLEELFGKDIPGLREA